MNDVTPQDNLAGNIIRPSLKPGSTIGIVSPGRWCDPSWIDRPKAFFESRGYKVAVHLQNYLRAGQLAGSDAERAKGIMDMFADPAVGAMIATRGGTGSLRVLDLLDYDFIRRHPKAFIGYSDVTMLLQGIARRSGIVTYHGPMGWNFAQEDNSPRTAEDFFAVVGNTGGVCTLRYTEPECVRPGTAEGVIVGGNIARLQCMLGTPYDWLGKDAILFLEDVDEVLYRIDGMLTQFRMAGKFDGVRAVLIGEMTDIIDTETGFARAGEKPYGKNFREIVMEYVPSDVPLCFNFPCGHSSKFITTLPIGALARLTMDASGTELALTLPAG